MKAGLRNRLARLERHHGDPADQEGVPPALFFEALSGRVPLDELDPKTRELVVWIGTPESEGENPVLARLRTALAESLGGAPVNGPAGPSNDNGHGHDKIGRGER